MSQHDIQTEDPGARNVITAAATAEVDHDRPAICGTVTLHCLDDGEPLRLVMPMLDAMLLLNSLREIEASLELAEWSGRLGCSLNAIERLSAELRKEYGKGESHTEVDVPETLPFSLIN